MSGGKYLGYHFYSAGVLPRELRLGNIVWDYRQPTRESPYVHKQDLSDDTSFFEPQQLAPLIVDFADKKGFGAALGVSVAWCRAEWGSDHKTNVSADEAQELHVISGKEEAFWERIAQTEEASKWLERRLSSAFTAAAYARRAFCRPKLWLCTGLITMDKGTYTVAYAGTKSAGVSAADPSSTAPVSLRVSVDTKPSTGRHLGVSSRTIVAAQWMLLYCANQRIVNEQGQQLKERSVTLSSTYAPDTVKGVDSPSATIYTAPKAIGMADRDGRKLFLDPDRMKESGDVMRSETDDLFEPMLPSEDTQEYKIYLRTLKQLDKLEQKAPPLQQA